MPRILELVPMSDGRFGVLLDVLPTGNDPDSVSVWTAEERDRAIASAAAAERVAILELVEAARKVAAKAPSQKTVNATSDDLAHELRVKRRATTVAPRLSSDTSGATFRELLRTPMQLLPLHSTSVA